MTESKCPTEGLIPFDIIFDAILPQKGEQIKIIVNIEVQKTTKIITCQLMKRGCILCLVVDFGTERERISREFSRQTSNLRFNKNYHFEFRKFRKERHESQIAESLKLDFYG